MTTRQALDLPCPIWTPATKLLATTGMMMASPRGETPPGTPANTSAVPSCSSGYSGAGRDAGVGDPHGHGPGRAGAASLRVGDPRLDLGPVHVPGEDGPLVRDHLRGDAERRGEDGGVAAAVADGQGVERGRPPVPERL